MAARWRIRQFGAVRVEGTGIAPGAGAEFETQRAAKILALLSLVGGGIRREDLADTLWPDDFYDATRLRLRKELSRLRQTLGPAAEILVTEGDLVALDRSLVESDLDRLRRAATTPEDAVRLAEAAEAVRGHFLPGWEDAWAVAERRAADGLKCRVLAALGERLLAQSEPQKALDAVREGIEVDPCHEGVRIVAVKAHAAMGSLANAIGEYQQMKRLMREWLHKSPSADAEATLMRIQAGEFTPVPPFESGPRFDLGDSRETPLPSLSLPVDRFFGRDEELAFLTDELAPAGPTRLVTLVGTGGIGKSRLAQQALLALRSAYGGQVAFVSLVEAVSPQAAAATLLAHMGWQGTAAADPVSVVASSLPPGPCLLVLDNLEHLLPESAELVLRLLGACPSLKVLATSRQTLRLAGERIVALGPLGEAAGPMLTELARLVRPALADDPEAVASLHLLAQRLDGIPLALRLAAARLRVLGPDALLERLDDRFRILQGAAVDLPERHRSLRAALDGSYEGLDPVERRVLVQMSPFRGGWTLHHLERLLPDLDCLDAMEKLVDASLVLVDDAGPSIRFGMLETIREYLADREGIEEARVAFVRTIADELWAKIPSTLTPRSFALLDALDPEADNLHIAVEMGIDVAPDAADAILSHLWIYDTSRGRQAEFERLCQAFDDAHPDRGLGPAAEFGRGMALAGIGQAQRAIDRFAPVERYCLEEGDDQNAALVRAVTLVAERRLRRYTLDEALAFFPALYQRIERDVAAVGRFEVMRTELLFYAGRLEEAAVQVARASEIAQRIGDSVGETIASQLQALLHMDLGRFELAQRELDANGPRAKRLGDPLKLAYHHELCGRAAQGLGRFEDAPAHFRAARRAWARLGNVFQMADQDNSLARAYLGAGRLSEAREAARIAFLGMQDCGDLGGVAVALHTLVAIHLAAEEGAGERGGGDEKAAEALAAALALQKEHGLEFVRSEIEFVERLRRRVEPIASRERDYARLFA